MQALDLEERSALEHAEFGAGSSSVGGQATATMRLSRSIVRRRKEATGEPLPGRMTSADVHSAQAVGLDPVPGSRDRRRVLMSPGRAVRFVGTNHQERTRMHYLLRFLRRGPISPRVHGTLDYLLAAALIAVPLAVDFHDDTATVLMLVLGGAATLLAIGTNWSTGIIRILPPVVHGVADVAATIVLIIAPFVLGFTDDTVATVLYVVIGAGGLGATLLTRFESDLMPAARIAPQQPAV
jgi:hypothetical protein